jgi:hypothetical protein
MQNMAKTLNKDTKICELDSKECQSKLIKMLRAESAENILKNFLTDWGPVEKDGIFFQNNASDLLLNGPCPEIPYIIGGVSNEGNQFSQKKIFTKSNFLENVFNSIPGNFVYYLITQKFKFRLKLY